MSQAEIQLQALWAHCFNIKLTEECTGLYTNGMKELWGEDGLNLNVGEMKKDHEWLRECALRKFDQSPKLGTQDIINSYKDQLNQKIHDWFENLVREKNTKATLAQQNKTSLVNVVSASVLAPIPVFGPLILLGLAFGDLAATNSEKATVEEENRKRQLKRMLLHSRHDH